MDLILVRIKGYVCRFMEDTSLFRTVYIISLFLELVAFLDIIGAVMKVICIALSIPILYRHFIQTRIFPGIRYKRLLLLFVLSSLITGLIHIKDNYLANIFMVYNSVMCFCIFYGMYIEGNVERIKKEMLTILKVIVMLSTIFVLVGFILVFIKDEVTISHKLCDLWNIKYALGVKRGLHESRLTGIYTNPNLLAFSCVVSVIFAHILFTRGYAFKRYDVLASRLILVACMLLNITALILTDSVASFIFLIIYIVVTLFYKLMVKGRQRFSWFAVKRGILFIVIGVLTVCFLVILRSSLQDSASNVVNDLHSVISKNTLVDEVDVKFGRQQYDIRDGSGRRELIKQAIILFEQYPVFGTGRANFERYGKLYFKEGLIFSDLHNGYLTILVAYGVMGFSLFIVFLILSFMDIVFFVVRESENPENNKTLPNLFAMIVAYGVFSLFEKTILSECTFMAVFFWLIFGYIMAHMYKKETLQREILDPGVADL